MSDAGPRWSSDRSHQVDDLLTVCLAGARRWFGGCSLSVDPLLTWVYRLLDAGLPGSHGLPECDHAGPTGDRSVWNRASLVPSASPTFTVTLAPTSQKWNIVIVRRVPWVVLHAFQKKSPSGRRTAARDVDLVAERLKAARKDHEEHYGKPKR